MKKAIAWILVLALTAALAVGGTLAYLTDTDEDVNVMTLGQVKIDQLEYERVDDEASGEDAEVQIFHDNKPLYPGVYEEFPGTDSIVDWEQIGKEDYESNIWNPDEVNNEVDKMVFVKNKGDYDAYVRTWFAFEAGKYETLDEFKSMVHLNLNEEDWTWQWQQTPVEIGDSKYFVATATYDKVLEPGKLTEISLSQILLDKTATNEDVEAFGDTYQVLVKSQAIQADGFNDPGFALNEGFGTELPWEDDNPVTGTDLKTALHYLDAKNPGTQITTKVKNIIFDYSNKYPEVVNNYEGALVDAEQDVPVYAYYVPNGEQYDVYILAEDTIYTPRDCFGLCQGMSALEKVDTTNMDVSRTESVYGWFHNCAKLTQIDTSKWDTSNVRVFNAIFAGCKALPTVDVSGWDTSSATTMNQMFCWCYAVDDLDVSGWDTSNVTSMYAVFYECKVLSGLDVSGWETDKVTNMSNMFQYCYEIEELALADWDVGQCSNFQGMFAGNHNLGNMKIVPEVENWDMRNAVNIQDMFYGCAQIKSLDLSKWNTPKLQNMHHTFCDCFGLESLDLSGLDTSNVTTMNGTFNDCYSLKELDVSNFDTGNVTTMYQMFEGCAKLTTVKGMENWDVSNVTSVAEMFNENSRGMALEYVDLSGWNTAKLTGTAQMFYGCDDLKTVYVGDGWDMSKVTSSGSMFAGCVSIVGGEGTSFDGAHTDVAYAQVDGGTEAPGYLTHSSDKSVEEPTE